jgi:lipopolysaccharide biosynthesis glycosyltransferase
MKKIIVTAADENFIDLLIGLLDSLKQCPDSLFDAIGLLDLGLSENSLNKIRDKVDIIIKPNWSLKLPTEDMAQKPYLRAMTERAFLPDYFPNFDLFIWLDSDTWVQNPYAISWLIKAAENYSLGVVPEVHQSYHQHSNALNWRTYRLKRYFSDESLNLYFSNNYFNSGVFALRRDAPHWKYWAEQFKVALLADPHLVSDQTVLNYATWKYNLSVHPLPAVCNWCCHLARPILDIQRKKFCEPNIPYGEIGIIHMAADAKDYRFNIKLKNDNLTFGYSFEDFKFIQKISY